MKMYIKAEDFRGILSAYYSELFNKKVNVHSECYYDIEGCYAGERKVKKVRFSYEAEAELYGHPVTQTVDLSQKAMKDALSNILNNYFVTDISFEITESDYYSSSLDFIGVELSLKEKQKKLELKN